MAMLYKIARWILAVFLALAAIGFVFGGSFLGGIIALAGCAIIAPSGGERLADRIKLLAGNERQVLSGLAVFILGMVMGISHESKSSISGKSTTVVSASQPVAPKFQCESGSVADGAEVEVLGADGHPLRAKPNGDKIVNQKASSALGSIQYQTIDNSTKVQIQCLDGDWAKVKITSPDWLTSQKGWVERGALAMPLKPGEVRDFTEADFEWDGDTSKAKTAIIKVVNRIHREDPRCKDAIYPTSVAKSDTESKAQKKPVFFVNCGDGAASVNVYFDAKRADDPTPFKAPGHIDKMRAIDLCEAYAKANATHPSTVDFSRVLDLAYSEHPNGRSRVLSSFTAKNSLNLELKFRINCLFDESGLIEANIAEDGR